MRSWAGFLTAHEKVVKRAVIRNSRKKEHFLPFGSDDPAGPHWIKDSRERKKFVDPDKVHEFKDAEAFYSWLSKHHASETEAWITCADDGGKRQQSPTLGNEVLLARLRLAP